MFVLVTLICSFNLSSVPVIKLTDSKCVSTVYSLYETKEECDSVKKDINSKHSGTVASCVKFSGKNLKIKFVK